MVGFFSGVCRIISFFLCYDVWVLWWGALGGGSFGTAMAAHVAERKAQLEVNILVRDPQVCRSINERHRNW